uniref:Uncharacterized protein n=1 Tax=Trichuris muris TaxID=70415 RepID=A0A5S6QRD5_TRIMR
MQQKEEFTLRDISTFRRQPTCRHALLASTSLRAAAGRTITPFSMAVWHRLSGSSNGRLTGKVDGLQKWDVRPLAVNRGCNASKEERTNQVDDRHVQRSVQDNSTVGTLSIDLRLRLQIATALLGEATSQPKLGGSLQNARNVLTKICIYQIAVIKEATTITAKRTHERTERKRCNDLRAKQQRRSRCLVYAAGLDETKQTTRECPAPSRRRYSAGRYSLTAEHKSHSEADSSSEAEQIQRPSHMYNFTAAAQPFFYINRRNANLNTLAGTAVVRGPDAKATVGEATLQKGQTFKKSKPDQLSPIRGAGGNVGAVSKANNRQRPSPANGRPANATIRAQNSKTRTPGARRKRRAKSAAPTCLFLVRRARGAMGRRRLGSARGVATMRVHKRRADAHLHFIAAYSKRAIASAGAPRRQAGLKTRPQFALRLLQRADLARLAVARQGWPVGVRPGSGRARCFVAQVQAREAFAMQWARQVEAAGSRMGSPCGARRFKWCVARRRRTRVGRSTPLRDADLRDRAHQPTGKRCPSGGSFAAERSSIRVRRWTALPAARNGHPNTVSVRTCVQEMSSGYDAHVVAN